MSRASRPARPPRQDGFSLVELLVATAILGVVLAAAYGWVWSVGSLAESTDGRVQACTIASALMRSVAEDVGGAVEVAEPVAGRDPAGSLAVVHDRTDETAEDILIVWDPARRVVWRNASGTYVADHILGFRVGFVLGDGRTVDGAVMGAADWRNVRAVRLALAVEVGAALVRRQACLELGSL